MSNNNKQPIYQINFQKKLFISYSIVIILLISGMFLYLSSYIFRVTTIEAQNNMDELTRSSSTDVTNIIDSMDNIAIQLSTNSDVIKVFDKARKDSVTPVEFSNLLTPQLTRVTIPRSAAKMRISMYNSKGNFISTGPAYTKISVNNFFQDTKLYNQIPIVNHKGYTTGLIQDKWSIDSSTLYLSHYRQIFDPTLYSYQTGIVEIQYPYSDIEKILTYNTDAYTAYLYDESGNCFFPAKTDKQLANDYYLTAHNQKQLKNEIYSFVNLDNDWTLIVVQSKLPIMTRLINTLLFLILMGLLLIGVGLYVIYFISIRISRPLSEFTNAVKNVDLDQMTLHIDRQITNINEIHQLEDAFSEMLNRLEHSMDNSLKLQANNMRANMIALQSQMDPHFLYNILAIIKAMSREGNSKDIGLVCNYLSSMLRYISTYDDQITDLATELKHVDTYLKLMKVRYDYQFEYNIDIPEEMLSNIKIPKLSIQPIAENCFKHGFNKTAPPWKVSIYGEYDKTSWRIYIQDNGIGINDTDIEKLRIKVQEFLKKPSDSIPSLKLGGLGLVNTIVRFQLWNSRGFYSIKPLANGGSLVMIGVENNESLSG